MAFLLTRYPASGNIKAPWAASPTWPPHLSTLAERVIPQILCFPQDSIFTLPVQWCMLPHVAVFEALFANRSLCVRVSRSVAQGSVSRHLLFNLSLAALLSCFPGSTLCPPVCMANYADDVLLCAVHSTTRDFRDAHTYKMDSTGLRDTSRSKV